VEGVLWNWDMEIELGTTKAIDEVMISDFYPTMNEFPISRKLLIKLNHLFALIEIRFRIAARREGYHQTVASASLRYDNIYASIFHR
jgi:hypothetical protein